MELAPVCRGQARDRLGAASVVVCWSSFDATLRAFAVGEALCGYRGAVAMGLVGPAPDSVGVEHVDCSDSVLGHNANLFLLSDKVLAAVLGRVPPRAEVSPQAQNDRRACLALAEDDDDDLEDDLEDDDDEALCETSEPPPAPPLREEEGARVASNLKRPRDE